MHSGLAVRIWKCQAVDISQAEEDFLEAIGLRLVAGSVSGSLGEETTRRKQQCSRLSSRSDR